MERFILVDIFREKSNTFLGTTVFFVFTEKTEIFRTINLWITRDGKKCTRILQMVHFNPFFGTKKKIPVPFDRYFSPKFPYKNLLVSALDTRHPPGFFPFVCGHPLMGKTRTSTELY